MNLFVRRNREPVARSDRIEIKKKKLHVHRAVAEDSGMYNCLAKNDAGSSPKMESPSDRLEQRDRLGQSRSKGPDREEGRACRSPLRVRGC